MAIDIRSRRPKRRFRMISFRVVFRSVWDHPFLVVMLLFLVYLYSCCPLLFSVLISASPYLVCTAVLLGTLLIHGQPNDYRRPSSGQKSNTSTSLKSEIGEHRSSVNGDGIFYKDRFSEVRNDIVEKGIAVSGVMGAVNSLDHVSEDANFKYHNPDCNQRSKIDGDKSKMGFPFTDFEDNDAQKCKVQAQNTVELYEERVKESNHCRVADYLDSSQDEQKRAGDSARHESSDSESDGGAKSSLDALVADVIPTPQETHPLLDCDGPVLPELTHGGSSKSELHSSASSESSRDSEEETDSDDDDRDDHDDHKHGVPKSNGNDDDAKSAISWTDDDRQTLLDLKRSEEEKNQHLESLIGRVGDEREDEEDEGDGEEDEEGHSDDEDDEDDLDLEKVGCEQHVTMWTEEDEKNLRDLGKVEQERNQRLENLLAKRRAQRNYSMIQERNLIDLDRCELPFQVAPISTNRVNPFEVPHNAHSQPSMPSIPGSAPSVTLPRRNPFDSPNTSPKAAQSAERDTPNKGGSAEINRNNPVFPAAVGSSSSGFSPVSVGDSLKHEFTDISRKENLFRRYESFSTGYKYVGETSRQDFMDIDRRDAVFRRHETFNTRTPFPSMYSHERGDAFRMKPVFVADQVAHPDMNHSSLERQSSQSSESSVSSRSESEPSIASVNDEDLFDEEVAVNEGDLVDGEDVVNEDPGMNHEIVLTNELHDDREEITIEDHGSSSSESESSEMVVSQQQSQDKHLEASTEMTTDENYQESKETDDDHEFSSSSTSSEEDDKFHNTYENENEKVGETSSSPQNSSEVPDLNHTSPEEDHIHVEPVYDTSPGSEINKPLFFDAAEN